MTMLNQPHTMSPPQKAAGVLQVASVSSCQIADFQLVRLDEGGWQLHVMSTRASYWLRANHVHLCEAHITLNLAKANAFLRSARKSGFKTEYIGPVSRTVL